MANITEAEYRAFSQRIQKRFVKIELLNFSFQTVEYLEGICITGNIAINANSDMRRSGNISLVINDSTFEVEPGGKIWLDKYVRVYVGTTDFLTQEIVWVNCGIFIIDMPTYQYDSVTNTLNLTLLDLMAKLTGGRDGYLHGVPVLISAGENIRQAIISTLALGGFNKYVVEEAPSPGTVPLDLEFNQGSTVYDVLDGLRNIYPNYEIYFDVNGVFFYKPIPTGINEPLSADDSLWNSVVLSENLSVDFQNVKNLIEVYGRTHNPAYFSTTTTVSNNQITLNSGSVSEYSEDIIYGFTLTDNTGIIAPQIQINSLGFYPVYDEDLQPINIEAEQGEVFYCVQFKGTYWYWLGHLQAYGLAQDDNPDSPFYIQGSIGELRLPLFSEEYANCLSDNLAQQRAQYELWLHTNMNNTVTLSLIPVFWLDVNMLVEYTLQRNNETNSYLIKSINYGLGESETQSITMIRYYPDNSQIINN